jgi:manganese/zinc/iron transport system permease protein
MAMTSLIPPFDFQQVFVAPWTSELSSHGWTMLMGFLVAGACGLVGNYLILRRMALVGDAISHSVLPGIVVAFLLAGSRHSGAMFAGALTAGVLTTVLIELIHKKSRVKQDAAIGITFTSLFALGVILVGQLPSELDLDQECVLYGEIGYVSTDSPVTIGTLTLGPAGVVRMAVVALLTATFVVLFYKELLVSSFDAGLATSLGINSTFVHYALMCWLSVVVVSAFEAVGAILVIAMLILPGACASLWTDRLPRMHLLAILHAALSSVLGLHLAVWLDCPAAGAMVVMGGFFFVLSWVFSPTQGLLRRWLQPRELDAPPAPESTPV